MKYTLKPPEQNQLSHPKPLSCNNTARNTAALHHSPTNSDASNLCYEPTSVGEIRGCPNPNTAVDVPPSGAGIPISDIVLSDDILPLQWGDHSDDWDKLLTGFALPDESVGSRAIPHLSQHEQQQQPQLAPVSELSTQFNHLYPGALVEADFNTLPDQGSSVGFDLSNDVVLHPQAAAHWNLGFNSVDELIRAAECVDSNELQLAQAILARLNQRVQSPAAGKPLQRTAFYFKEALQFLLAGSPRLTRASSSEIVQTMRAYKALSGISPIPMFSHFTANQALLEAVDGSAFIHVVDFDIGLGGKWASFMKVIADRSEARKLISPVLRITAVVPEEFAAESRLIEDSLKQFAHDLRLEFDIDFVLTRSFDDISFNAIKFMEWERIGVHLSPATFARLAATGGVAGFLANLRRLSPNVVVFVDGEGCVDGGGVGGVAPSFRRGFIAGLEFYSTMLESLDASCGGGGGDDWMRKIEVYVVRPKIYAAVEAAGRRMVPWKEVLEGAGLRTVQPSQFALFLAECLLGKAQVKGFHVATRQGEMVLCWNQRPLVATSAWRC